MTNLSSKGWYIVKQPSEQCKIVPAEAFLSATEKTTSEKTTDASSAITEEQNEKWGPFETQHQAIAKRVGLIRAGKCKPS